MNVQDLLYYNALEMVFKSKSTLILSYNSQTYLRIYPSIKPHLYVVVSYTNKYRRFKLPFRVFRFKDEDIIVSSSLVKASIIVNKQPYQMVVLRVKM